MGDMTDDIIRKGESDMEEARMEEEDNMVRLDSEKDKFEKQEEQPKGVRLKCQRCGYIWTYKGKNQWLAPCPTCMIKVSINKNKIESDI